MARRSVVTLVTLLALVLGLVLWVARGLGGRTLASPDTRDAAVAPAEAPEGAPRPTAAPDLAVSAAHAKPDTPASSRAIATPSISDVGAADLADANWVEGRLVFPTGTPIDENVVVVAQGREFEHSKKPHRAQVEPDGRFRVAFSKKTKKGWLRIEARYLYLTENLEVKPETARDEIVLRPEIGGGFRCKLVPSAAAQPFVADLVGQAASVRGWQENRGVSRNVTAQVDPDLEFVLGGLEPGLNWSLQFDPKGFAGTERDALSVQKGVLQPLELQIARGAHVTGRVLDETGTPVAKAEVSVAWKPDEFSGRQASTRAKPDGTFELEGVHAGKVRLEADQDGFVRRRLDEIEFHDGEERAGIDIVLSRGNSVAGIVRWPDGTPGADVKVDVAEPPAPQENGTVIFSNDSKSTVRTAADGTFTISGLGAGPYTVTALSLPKEIAAAPAGASKSGGKKPAKARFSAELENVQANQKGLVLALRSGGSVSGRVVDDVGQPVSRVLVRALPAESNGNPWSNEGMISQLSTDAGGQFELLGLKDGEWDVVAEIPNGPKSARRRVTIPGAHPPIELVVARAGAVVGVVLDPAGAPVANARVGVSTDEPGALRYSSSDSKQSKSDPTGHFRIENMGSGSLRVHADHPDWARSAEVDLDLGPAQVSAPLTLQLRRGGTIAGQVQDRAGKPAAGRSVSLWADGQDWRRATTLADGSFRFEKLAPGRANLDLEPSAEERAVLSDENGSIRTDRSTEFNRSLTVEVEDGKSVDVVLGGAPAAPVRLFGLVTAAGRPLSGAQVAAYAYAEGDRGESRQTVTDATGRYEITLARPCKCQISVSSRSGSTASVEKTLPDARSCQVDIALPAGTIAGRVVSADGVPLAGIDVQLGLESRPQADSKEMVAAQWGNARSRADGSFAFDLLGPGTYSLTATSESDWIERPQKKTHGRVKLADLVLAADGRLDGIELRMPQAGLLTGIVLGPDGTPAANAAVIVTDPNGESLNAWSERRTDSAGRFRVTGLSPGTVTVRASTRRAATRAAETVSIQGDATSDVSLRLEPATLLHVVVVNAHGQGQFCPIEVLDEHGFGHEREVEVAQGRPSPEIGWPIGPLVSGTYTVVVHGRGEKSSRTEVKVGAGDEQTVRIPLPE